MFKRAKRYSKTVQEHHISYCAAHVLNPNTFPCKGCKMRNKAVGCWTVKVFKGEHWILTQLSHFTKKDVSAGFLMALDRFLQINKARAREIEYY